MQQLNKNFIHSLQGDQHLKLPTKDQLEYPEKVLQFGTGVLLRGLPDQYIEDANRSGRFRGRIVVVKTTEKGSANPFEKQDGLYSVCIKGLHHGITVDKTVINSSISRVLNAAADWPKVMEFALSPNLEVVISNTTEVGIVLSEDKIPSDEAPSSFPGKLLEVLYKRFLHYSGDNEKGLVIIPAELIEENGTKLKNILNELSEKNCLGQEFISWLNNANQICNSLVDRIVPGKMGEIHHKEKEVELGYKDDLMIMAEPFGLWAIESASPKVIRTLTFSNPDSGCIIVPSIEKYKEIKIRLLNGTHTFSCGVALLSGVNYVKEAMADPQISLYVRSLLFDEITPTVVSKEISEVEAIEFAHRVIDRFSNPFIEHKWENISAQFTSKMIMRNLPLLIKSAEKFGKVPRRMVIGFCAYLLCLHTDLDDQGNFLTKKPVRPFILNDGHAAQIHALWQNADRATFDIISNKAIWGADLTALPGFVEEVIATVDAILKKGIRSVL